MNPPTDPRENLLMSPPLKRPLVGLPLLLPLLLPPNSKQKFVQSNWALHGWKFRITPAMEGLPVLVFPYVKLDDTRD